MPSVPTVNGYRRLAAEFSLSPSAIDWKHENRTAMLRVLGAGRTIHVENRIGEPCANPYLMIAGQLGAGLEGLEQRLGESGAASRSGTLPATLAEALEIFRDSDHVRRLLGEPLTACLTRLKESETGRFEAWRAGRPGDPEPAAGVTEWEHREYFGVY